MSKLNQKLNERQPNSDSREEFLIVIEYLLNEAYDEKHATTQADIVEYAKNKYNIEIRRDRIPQILIHLLQIQEKDPNRLPFKIKVKESEGSFKCYVEERMLTNKEIIDISSSIVNDKTKTDSKANSLVEKILDIASNEHNKEVLRKKINKANRKGTKLKNALIEKYEILLDANTERKLVWFRFTDFNKVDISKQILATKKLLRNTNDTSHFAGFVRQIVETGSGTHVVFYVDSIGGEEVKIGLDSSIENVEIIDSPINTDGWYDDVTFELSDGRNTQYESPEEWTRLHYQGQDGIKHKFIVKTCIDSKKSFEKFTRIYEEFWKKKLEYEEKERIIKTHYRNENGELLERDLVVKDAYITIESNFEAFRKWYLQYDVLSVTVIMEPNYYNDFLVGDLVDRLIRRLNKYGAVYDYQVNKTYKEEYKQAIEDRRKRVEEYRKQKEERQSKKA